MADGGLFSGFAGSLLGGAAQIFGAGQANKQNEMNMLQQQNWQEMMSNSAHQREVADLRSAGLNPILSAMGAGASTPSGGMATAENTMAGMGATAKELSLFSTQLENIRAQTNKAKAETEAVKKGYPQLDAQGEMYKAIGEGIKAALGLVKNEGQSGSFGQKLGEVMNNSADATKSTLIRVNNAFENSFKPPGRVESNKNVVNDKYYEHKNRELTPEEIDQFWKNKRK